MNVNSDVVGASVLPSERTGPTVALIAAVGPNRLIGGENRMPWHLPRDLRFFRQITSGHAVLMGRKTFESLGKRPLPKRRNIVVTRQLDYEAPGCEVAHSLESAIALCQSDSRVFVIGGGLLFQQAMPLADEIYITEIASRNPTLPLFPLFTGDTYFPKLDESAWTLTRPGKRWFLASCFMKPKYRAANPGLYFRFRIYQRARHLTATQSTK